MATVPETQYNEVAQQYESMEDLPCSQLEAQLVLEALGDCRGLKVLDLGGGSGMHARKAADSGAATIDVVDLSAGMLQVGRDSEASLGRDLIRWHRADVSKPLGEQGIAILQPGEYDVVMANWVLDHSASPEQLRGMWENIARYSRSGARFLGIRVANPRAECYRTGKYGIRYDDVKDVPDGISYKVVYLTDPVLEFEGVSMAESMSLSTDIPTRLGFVNIQVLSPEKTPVVKGDLEYWKMYLEDPGFVAVTATKA